jgi:uncharacterized protein YndB with AHSA1/START domain
MPKVNVTATPGGYEVIVETTIKAPLDKVWQAYIDPDLVVQWLGPRRLKGTIDTWEHRPGGKWAFTHSDEEGNAYSFHGYFHEIVDKERLVQTFEFEGTPGNVSMDTAYFEADGDQTKIRTVSVFQSPEARDAMIKSGMEKGITEGFERMEELLEQA